MKQLNYFKTRFKKWLTLEKAQFLLEKISKLLSLVLCSNVIWLFLLFRWQFVDASEITPPSQLKTVLDSGLHITFEQPNQHLALYTQFSSPDTTPGVTGKAWRTDGFSSWAEISLNATEQQQNAFTLMTWVALESYPSDKEVRTNALSPSSLIRQGSGQAGFDIFMDTFGRWGLRLQQTTIAANGSNSNNEPNEIRVAANTAFPLYQWNHVALTLSKSEKKAQLFLNGAEVAALDISAGLLNQISHWQTSPIVLAKPLQEANILNFTVNYLNAAYDDFYFVNQALSSSEINQVFKKYANSPQFSFDATLALKVPPSRFSSDHLRPRFHAMPPANWTNEPHGLVRRDNRWHMFYQRTPNGPYKTQMHWGHLVSDDLVNWENVQDALWPTLQNDEYGFDMKGIWSGDVIIDGDTAFAFYTSVNHFDRLKSANPGIAMAISRDPDLLHWEKTGPIINTRHVADFRDPYLWKESDTWHMIIGAAYRSKNDKLHGGLDYYILTPTSDGNPATWQHQTAFSSISYRKMDIGSDIWEMPVFEPLSDEVYVLVVNPIGGKVQKYGKKATRGVYWTGSWENGKFHPHYRTPKPLDLLVGHLSPTVARAQDGKLRAIGIVDERRTPQAQEDAGWTHTFSAPRMWFLMPDGKTLGQAPAPELKRLRTKQLADKQNLTLENNHTISHGIYGYELLLDNIASNGKHTDNELTITLLSNPNGEEATQLTIHLQYGTITLDKSQSNQADTDEGPLVLTGQYDKEAFGNIRSVRMFVDGSVVDVFINDAAAFSFRSYPSSPQSTYLSLTSESSAKPIIGQVKLWQLKAQIH